MKKAVFFDRDGVVNMERGEHTWRQEDFEFVDGVIATMKSLQDQGYLIVIITNQSGIARGIYHHEDVGLVHDFMKSELSKSGVKVDAVYYCPHFDELGRCLCRKPDSLMIEKALARFDIDAHRSFLIGDSDRDIIAAEKAGIKGIKIEPNGRINLEQA